MKRLMIGIAVGFGLVGLAAFQTPNQTPYPQELRSAFMDSCTGGGAPENICACAFRNIERTYTLDAYLAWEDALTASRGHPMTAEVQKIAERCVANPNL